MADDNLCCSFCRKPRAEVDILIVAPAANICETCVGKCLMTIVKNVSAGDGGCAACTRAHLMELLAQIPADKATHPHVH